MSTEAIPSTNRIVFASCTSQHYEQVLWQAILARDPSLFVWGGDAIYADSYEKIATPDIYDRLYKEQKRDPGYKELLDRNVPIVGVFDDHDYGTNNGDRTHPYRTESGVAFACDFLNQAGTAFCDRARKGLGVYGVKVMDFNRPKGQELLSDEEAGLDPDVVPGPTREEEHSRDNEAEAVPRYKLSNRSVAIFLLDVRSNRTPTTKHGLDSADYEGDFLGEEQWTWFEAAMKRSTAAVNIVVQGIQVHADKLATADMAENWSNFPTSQHRLYQALLQEHVNAPILVSGDVHHAQLLRKDCQLLNKRKEPVHSVSPNKRMLLEVTTSGMTHSWGTETCARPHQTFLCRMNHVKWAAKQSMQMGQWINGRNVWTELLDLSSNDMATHWAGEGKSGKQFTLELNFAEFQFDWTEQSVNIKVLGKEVESLPLLSTRWHLDSLSGRRDDIRMVAEDQYFVDTYNKLERNGGFGITTDEQWVCVAYRGSPDPIHKVIGAIIPVTTALLLVFLPFCLPVLLLSQCWRGNVRRKQKLS